MKIAIIVHVFYSEFWLALTNCIRRVNEPYNLFITYSDVPEKRLEQKEERMSRKMKKIVDWYDTQLRSS